MDYRNMLCVPRKLSEKLQYSDAFNLAHATNALFRVDANSIFTEVYPECKLGGELCRGDDITARSCCGENMLKNWHETKTCPKPVAMQGFTYSKRATDGLWKTLRQRANIA